MKPAFALLAAASAVCAQADLTSTFDADAQGWRGANVDTTSLATTYGDLTWVSGHVEGTEFASGLYLLAAPAPYLGDLRAYNGGALTFRLADATSDGVAYPSVLIRSGASLMYYKGNGVVPGTALTAFQVPFEPSGWRVGFFGASDPAPTATQFQAALANVTDFGLNADWTTNTQDRVMLDDVRLAAPVPEPALLAPFALCLAALARRFRRTI